MWDCGWSLWLSCDWFKDFFWCLLRVDLCWFMVFLSGWFMSYLGFIRNWFRACLGCFKVFFVLVSQYLALVCLVFLSAWLMIKKWGWSTEKKIGLVGFIPSWFMMFFGCHLGLPQGLLKFYLGLV